eukprot:Rmarinus@m.28327
MSALGGRQSQFKHVFGTACKPDYRYFDFKFSKSALDSSNRIAASGKFWAAPEHGVSGPITVVRLDEYGKVTTRPGGMPNLDGHKAAVFDLTFSPFDDHLLASGSEDGEVKVWRIPEEGVTSKITDSELSFKDHGRRVGTVDFHPVASNVLATSGGDNVVRLYDIERGSAQLNISGHEDYVCSLSFNTDGSLCATSCKDRKVRILDPRSESIAMETDGHSGAQGSRVAWITKTDRVASVGHGEASRREVKVYDTRKFDTPVGEDGMDAAAGVLIPFYDEDTGMLYVVGKGDTSLRYYEMINEAPFQFALNEYRGDPDLPTKGITMLPKSTCDVMKCEVAKFLRLTVDNKSNNPSLGIVESLTFVVPRRSMENFQDDVFSTTRANRPASTSQEWFDGTDAEVEFVSVRPEGVKAESEMRKDEPKQKKIEQFKRELDEQEKNEEVISELYTKMTGRFREDDDTPVPDEVGSGCDDDEWSD